MNQVSFVQGWGCGYRSLQSLCSWAITQLVCSHTQTTLVHKDIGVAENKSVPADLCTTTNLVEGHVPSIQRIQEVLVTIGDKPQSFVGSKEWIGCFEACIVMDHLFQVASAYL